MTALANQLRIIIASERNSIPFARLDTATGDIGTCGMRRRILRTIAMALLAQPHTDRRAMAEKIFEDLDEAGFTITRKAAL